MSRTHAIRVTVNGEAIEADVPARQHLTDFLRGALGLTGSHLGCEHGVCGACTVRVDGVAVRGCLFLAVQADGAEIETVEGLASSGGWDDLLKAFVGRNALQCGFCTPGMLASAIELIERAEAAKSAPDRAETRAHLSGNYCRCTGYQAIVDAVLETIDARLGGKR